MRKRKILRLKKEKENADGNVKYKLNLTSNKFWKVIYSDTSPKLTIRRKGNWIQSRWKLKLGLQFLLHTYIQSWAVPAATLLTTLSFLYTSSNQRLHLMWMKIEPSWLWQWQWQQATMFFTFAAAASPFFYFILIFFCHFMVLWV